MTAHQKSFVPGKLMHFVKDSNKILKVRVVIKDRGGSTETEGE